MSKLFTLSVIWEWMEMKDLGRLNMAVCNCTDREHFLQFVNQHELPKYDFKFLQQFTLNNGDTNFVGLVSEHYIIRKMKQNDLSDFHKMRTNPEVARFQSWQTNITLETNQQTIEYYGGLMPNILDEWIGLAIACPFTDSLIGEVGFVSYKNTPNDTIMGISIVHEYQRQGVASEVIKTLLEYLFQTLNKHKVIARIIAKNYGSIVLFNKLGFKQQSRDMIVFKGEKVAEFTCVLTCEDWLKSAEK